MTKKEYKIIARALNSVVWNYQGEGIPQEVLKSVITALLNEMIRDNPLFNIEKFKEAIYKK